MTARPQTALKPPPDSPIHRGQSFQTSGPPEDILIQAIRVLLAVIQSRFRDWLGRRAEKPFIPEPFVIMIDKQLEKSPELGKGILETQTYVDLLRPPSVVEQQAATDPGRGTPCFSRVIFIHSLLLSLPNHFQDWEPEVNLFKVRTQFPFDFSQWPL